MYCSAIRISFRWKRYFSASKGFNQKLKILTCILLQLIEHFGVVEEVLAIVNRDVFDLAQLFKGEFLLPAQLVGVYCRLKECHKLAGLLGSISFFLLSFSLVLAEEFALELSADVS